MSADTRYVTPSIGSVVEGGDDTDGASEIKDSLCMQCQGSGTTRMLITKIPFFREVIISSFECEDCQWTNNEVLFGGELQEKGCTFEVTVQSAQDLNRQIIKSDYATITFPSIDFQIPAKSQQGEVTTIEGLLKVAAERLGYEQPYRMEHNPEVGEKVADVIIKLSNMAMGEVLPFPVIVDDPSGNSFVENPQAPSKDPNLTVKYYTRTAEQDSVVGLQPKSATEIEDTKNHNAGDRSRSPTRPKAQGMEKLIQEEVKRVTERLALNGDGPALLDESETAGGKENFMHEEHVRFEDACPNCHKVGETLMCMVNIPHFKEVIIMAFTCECGYKSNEVKGGGAVPQQGTRHTLTLTSEKDLARDLLKSDTCTIKVPELELELEMGTLGSMYTSVEGLLSKIQESLAENNPFYTGDSSTQHHAKEGSMQTKFRVFLQKLEEYRTGEDFPFTLVLEDPMANSFVGSHQFENPDDDPQIETERYNRSHDEDEMLGLNDIDTEAYEVVPDGQRGDIPVTDHHAPKQHRVGTDHPVTFTKGMTENDTTKASDNKS